MRASLFLLATLIPLLRADDAADFAKWWPSFQAAVANRDAHTIVRGVQFPLEWENMKIRELKSEAELAKNFDVYFTAELRKLIATKKIARFPNGEFHILWHARNSEYVLYFKSGPAGSFILGGLSEGPI